MLSVYTGSQIRQAEQPLLAAGQGPALMRTAAWGLAQGVIDLLRERRRPLTGTRITGLIGPGNNGGDGLWALSFLAKRGALIRAHRTAETSHPEGTAAFLAAGGRFIDLEDADYRRSEVLIDAVLGTGARGAWSALPVPEAALVVACDIPSGVAADTGAVAGSALRADLTVTFGGLKTGLLNGAGASYSGQLRCVDIGLGPHLPEPAARLLEPADLPELLPPTAAAAHKYTRGVLGVLAGSTQYPGAANLACAAALATGVGMLRFLGRGAAGTNPKSPGGQPELDALELSVITAHPEAVLSHDPHDRVQAWLVGSGLGDRPERVASARAVLTVAEQQQLPTVIDADGLHLVEAAAGPAAERSQRILTPHAGEASTLLARLGGTASTREQVEADPLAAAQQLARLTGDVVVLKGPHTVIASSQHGQQLSYLYPGGHPWLATAGSGDTLAGIIAAIVAGWAGESASAATNLPAGRPPLAAQAAAGVWLHGAASYRAAADGPFGASSLASSVRRVRAELL